MYHVQSPWYIFLGRGSPFSPGVLPVLRPKDVVPGVEKVTTYMALVVVVVVVDGPGLGGFPQRRLYNPGGPRSDGTAWGPWV